MTMKTILRSKELTCPSCIAKIEKALERVEGVEEATVHFTTGRIEVIHDAERAPGDKLVAVVREAGYESKVSPF
jgi:copper chaperone